MKSEEEIREKYEHLVDAFPATNDPGAGGRFIAALALLEIITTLGWVLNDETEQVKIDTDDAMRFYHRENPKLLARYLGHR